MGAMHDGQRCVALFKWDGQLPGFDVESDPERLTMLTARAPAEAILNALRARNHPINVDVPYEGEGGWHFTIQIDARTFGVFTLWTGIDRQDYFAATLELKRGCFALFRKPVHDERLEPVCRALDDALATLPRVTHLRWLTDSQFAQAYCRGQPLPPAPAARPGGARG
jgi:hypothetical protein